MIKKYLNNMEYIYKDQIIVSSNNKKGAGGG